MGVRRRIFELVNSKMPSWASAKLRYEGVVTVMDTNLTGTARFAKKLGQPLPVWVVDTSTVLTTAATATNTYIEVEANPWYQVGSRIRLNRRYDVYISDITGDGTRLHLQSQLGAAFPVGTEVTLWDVPVTVSGTFPGPVTEFVLHSQYPVYRGDDLVFDTFHEITVASAVQFNTTPEGLRVYLVNLTTPYELALADELVIGLRAYPSYESPKMLTPTRQPFVYDRVSGVFYEDMNDVEEVDTVTLYDDVGAVLETIDGYKNLPITRTAVPVDTFLFGKRMEGTVKWDATLSAVVMIPGARGRAYIRYPLVPAWPVSTTSWAVMFDTTGPAKVSVTLAPGPKVLTTFPAAGSYLVNVPMPGVAVDEIQIKVFGESDVNVRLRSWTPSIQSARMFSHTTVAKVAGPWLWGSTGALLKRNLRLSDVSLTSDNGDTLTSGYFLG